MSEIIGLLEFWVTEITIAMVEQSRSNCMVRLSETFQQDWKTGRR